MVACLLLAATTMQCQSVIEGKVTDENGDPLIGCNILIKGTHQGAVSSVDGKFKLTVPDSCATLVFSYTGYESKTIESACKGKFLKVQLDAGSVELEEAVVIGYGIAEKRHQLMAMSTIAPPATNTESYDLINENQFYSSTNRPLSTFSIDVDAASYSNIRRFINDGEAPPKDAVRIEEMINYFQYDYPQPQGQDPFEVVTELGACPWTQDHLLLHVGLQGYQIDHGQLPASNLVFLIDVSGSMQSANKLPLLKSAFKMLVDQLRPQDKVALVVYAGAAGVVLPPTSGAEKPKIKAAIDGLEAGGSTAGAQGIRLAYETARKYFVKGGNNRVILATDGDFNVGVSSDSELVRIIEKERESGIFLTALGFGSGNYKDSKMQKLADKGNGNHAYIDNLSEAKKVLVEEFGGTVFAIAKDVKLQLEFNPAKVQGYRLIGYENRLLEDKDFDDDTKDAGELGSGHSVTALYEIIPVGVKSDFLAAKDLKYQETTVKTNATASNDWVTIQLRYKHPEGKNSKLLERVVKGDPSAKPSENFKWSAAVAQFGMLLRDSEFKGSASYEEVIKYARAATGKDKHSYRKEMISLMEAMRSLRGVVADKK